MKKKYKNLLRNLFLFFISSFIPKIISFILIPIYTSFLTTTEYGVSDLINTTVSLFMPIMTLNVRDAVLRFSLDKNYSDKDCLNIFLRIIFFDIVILSLFTLIELFFNPFKINITYLLFFDIILMLNSLYDLFNAYCKGTDKIKTILIASISNSLITLFSNIILIVILEMGLIGCLLANSLGLLVANLVFFIHPKIYKDLSLKYSKKQCINMIKYSFPMIFSAIAWWINNASDRYILSAMIGVSASGIYAVSSKIPSILTTFQNIFMQAWSISAIKEFDKNDRDGFIGNMYTISCFGLSFVGSLIMIFNIPISKILFAGDFFVAWKYVPPLVLSVIIDGLALFIGNLFYAVKDTNSRAFATIIGAIMNIFLNFLLIGKFGAYGAANATLSGYFLGFVFSRVLIKKHLKINTNMFSNDFVLLLLFLQVILAYFGNRFVIFQILIFFFIIFVYRRLLLKLVNVFKVKLLKYFN